MRRCPLCQHVASAHPRNEKGGYSCKQSLNALPSCQVCALPLQAAVEPSAVAAVRNLVKALLDGAAAGGPKP